ncbi:MAG: 2-dehydropantoate 2-reductase [Acidimicrobiales bacterium]|nr:2-dehydropantoate 2-reductase [Acidimicrobiales bacterium]
MTDITSVTLIGPGAIGCAVAGALVGRDEVNVTIAARTAFDRLRVDGPPVPVDAPVRAITDPAAAEVADVVLLVTKTHQTAGAAEWLRASCGPETVVAVLQNGIGHRELVGPLVGEAAVVPTIVFLPADRHSPGRVTVGLPATLQVPDDDPSRRIVDLFAGTYVNCTASADFHTTAWSKLVSNCGVGAVTTLTGTTNGILRDPDARELCIAVMEEAIAVAIADGAALEAGVADALADIVIDRSAGHMSSQTTDRLAGQPTEWEARQLEVVRRADQRGVAIPFLRALTTLVRLGEPDVGESEE